MGLISTVCTCNQTPGHNQVAALACNWACSQRNKSHLKAIRNMIWILSWFESLILALVKRKALSNQAFEMQKKSVFWIVIRLASPILRTFKRKAFSERDLWVCILEMRAKTMHGSISTDCTVGTKYYLEVCRSCSWLGRRLQCLWTHVVQITNWIRKRIVIRISFWNVIRSFVNRPTDPNHCITDLWFVKFVKIKLLYKPCIYIHV